MNFLKKYLNFIIKQYIYTLNQFRYIKFGYNSLIKDSIIITPKFISIGRNVLVQPHSRIEGISFYQGDYFNPKIIIDDNCTIQQNIHLTCGSSIYIGKNTAIAANVTITDINHQYENISLPIENQPINVNSVYIGDDCKIYNNSVILPGTKLGKHCVIGANSVVNGSYQDYCVIVGIPAKIIKRYCFDSNKWKKTDSKGNFL